MHSLLSELEMMRDIITVLVVSDSFRSQGLQHTILLCPWKMSEVAQSCLTLCNPMPFRLLHPSDFPGKNTEVSCHFLLQGIFLTQGSNTDLLHCRQTLPFEPPGNPLSMEFSTKNTEAGSHSLLQGILLTQRLNLGIMH